MTDVVDRGFWPVPVDFEAVRSDWERQGFTFGVFRDPPGQEWNDFVHSTDEYVVVAEGRLEIEVGTERVTGEPGDLIRIPRQTAHSLKTISAEGSVWLYGYGNWE